MSSQTELAVCSFWPDVKTYTLRNTEPEKSVRIYNYSFSPKRYFIFIAFHWNLNQWNKWFTNCVNPIQLTSFLSSCYGIINVMALVTYFHLIAVCTTFECMYNKTENKHTLPLFIYFLFEQKRKVNNKRDLYLPITLWTKQNSVTDGICTYPEDNFATFIKNISQNILLSWIRHF